MHPHFKNTTSHFIQRFQVGGEVTVDHHIKTHEGTNQTSCSQTGATVLPVAAFNQIYKNILLLLFVVSISFYNGGYVSVPYHFHRFHMFVDVIFKC